MICKENSIDVISIAGNTTSSLSANTQLSNGGSGIIINGHATLQHRRKSQLITFSASTCDIKNSLSHEIITPNNCNTSHLKNNPRNSLVGSIGSGNVMGMANPRLSFAEEDIMITSCHNGQPNGSYTGSGSGSGSGTGSGCGSGGPDQELEDEVFRRRSLEVDEEAQEALYEEEYGTHIEMKSNNANDDSGGGSYEDSHAMHSSLGGSNRNSLEKDDMDDDMEVDVISTDVSCYDQLLGSSCNNTRNDEDDIATIVAEGETYTKFTKNTFKKGLNGVGAYSVNGVTIGGNNGGGGGGDCSSGGIGENGGIIYANPFMDDEGIAESGM